MLSRVLPNAPPPPPQEAPWLGEAMVGAFLPLPCAARLRGLLLRGSSGLFPRLRSVPKETRKRRCPKRVL